MIENFAFHGLHGGGELLGLNRTSKNLILVSLMIPKFARALEFESRRTSQSGH